MSTTITQELIDTSTSFPLSTPSKKELNDSAYELQAYRKAYATSKEYQKRSNFKSFIGIFNNYVVFVGCILACEHAQSLNKPTLWWAVYTFSALIIGSRLRALEHLVHEACHHNLFTSVRLHDQLEFLFAFPAFRIVQIFRVLHLEHHKYLGDPVRDADVVRLISLGVIGPNRPSQAKWYWLIFGLPFTGFFQYEYLITLFHEFWTCPDSYPSKLLYWASVLAGVHHFNVWKGFALYFVVPWLGILPITRWWAEIGEHLGQDMTKHFGNSRTNDGFWQRMWIHPLSDGLHSTHHLNSQVPFYRLRDAHERLMRDNQEYREKTKVCNGMFETFRQIMKYDTTIREKSDTGKAEWDKGQFERARIRKD